MAKVEFTVTGEITSSYKEQRIDMTKIKISVLKDDESNYPVSVEMDCDVDKKSAEILSKHFKMKDILKSEKYQLSFSLKKDVMLKNINEINKVFDINSLVKIDNAALIILDNYDYSGKSLN